MKPPKALTITPLYVKPNGDLEVNVRLNRRSFYAFRLLYRSARAHGVGRLTALRISLGVVTAPRGNDRSEP